MDLRTAWSTNTSPLPPPVAEYTTSAYSLSSTSDPPARGAGHGRVGWLFDGENQLFRAETCKRMEDTGLVACLLEAHAARALQRLLAQFAWAVFQRGVTNTLIMLACSLRTFGTILIRDLREGAPHVREAVRERKSNAC
eukprot:1137197-Pelagomonas_calceolata.AAC.2